jgi:hypothetical protein
VTLAIAVVAGDGIAVAADSRTSLQPEGKQSRVLSDYTHKVFKVANIAIATYGYAFLSMRNIAGHMSEFAQRFTRRDASAAAGRPSRKLGPHLWVRFVVRASSGALVWQ